MAWASSTAALKKAWFSGEGEHTHTHTHRERERERKEEGGRKARKPHDHTVCRRACTRMEETQQKRGCVAVVPPPRGGEQ